MSIEQSAKQFSEQFNVDAGAVKCLLAFFERNIKEHAAQGIDFAGMSEDERAEYVRAGVTTWNRQSQEFFAELLANKTERAKKWRAEITAQIYDEIKARQVH